MKFFLIAFIAISLLQPFARAQWITQNITLTPGWNAVFLEVHPQPSDADIVFAGLPVESAWEWNRNAGTVEYIQDAAKLIPRLPEWATWFPEASPSRVVANLFDIRGGRAMLIKLGGSATVAWNVTGTPARPEVTWAPDSFTLTGFHVKSTGAPAFASYFSASPAHLNQQIYQMNAQGAWTYVPGTATIQRGRAYWVRTKGTSTYLGPMDVTLERAAGIDFGAQLEQAEVILNNRSATATQTVALDLGPSGPRPAGVDSTGPVAGQVLLFYRDFAQPGAISGLPEWKPFAGTLNYTLAPGDKKTVQFATRRAEFSAPAEGSGEPATYQAIIEVTGSSGQRQALPVTAQSVGVAETAGAGLRVGNAQTHRYTGLWVGSASVNQVNWLGGVGASVIAANPNFNQAASNYFAQQGLSPAEITAKLAQLRSDPQQIPAEVRRVVESLMIRDKQTPLPAKSEFPMRLIIHVDASGQARLLQKVIQVWENGTLIPDPDNPALLIPGSAGAYRLFISEQAASAFANPAMGTGATLRNGVPVPRRISTVSFPVRTPVAMAGNPGTGALTAAVVIGYNDPLNPFKHGFHPQHDNKDAAFNATLPPNIESWSVSRAVRLEFAAAPPGNVKSPGWGDSELGGIYKESITGVHRDPLNVAGTFLLRRISRIATLD